MVELEKKMLLTKDEYDYLLEHFGKDDPIKDKPIVKQVNYYFDTQDLSMNRQNITCRIRLKDGKYIATMKCHTNDSDHSTETSIEVRNGIFDNGFIDMGLTLQGVLTTDRCVIIKDEYCEVVLDKNSYLDNEDYELEIEYTSEHEKKAASILRVFKDLLLRRKCFLAYQESFADKPSIPSKSSRFFERRAMVEEKKDIANILNHHMNTSNDSIDEYPYDESDEMYSDYQNPDEYLDEYFYPPEYDESVCLSCIHWDGTTCDAGYGRCEYEHY